MKKRERKKFKLFAEEIQEITGKLFNDSIQTNAAYDLYLMAILPKRGRRHLNKDKVRNLISAGLSSKNPHANYGHQGHEDEDFYRGILRSEARAYVNTALTEVILAVLLGKGDKEFCSLIGKNMRAVCKAYGRCKALEQKNGHLHSMLIDFQKEFAAKYDSMFDSLRNYDVWGAETSHPD